LRQSTERHDADSGLASPPNVKGDPSSPSTLSESERHVFQDESICCPNGFRAHRCCVLLENFPAYQTIFTPSNNGHLLIDPTGRSCRTTDQLGRRQYSPRHRLQTLLSHQYLAYSNFKENIQKPRPACRLSMRSNHG
jgi:hypothetical protein